MEEQQCKDILSDNSNSSSSNNNNNTPLLITMNEAHFSSGIEVATTSGAQTGSTKLPGKVPTCLVWQLEPMNQPSSHSWTTTRVSPTTSSSSSFWRGL